MTQLKAVTAPHFPADLPEPLRLRWEKADCDRERSWALLDITYHYELLSHSQAAKWALTGLNFSLQAGDQLMSARFMLVTAHLQAGLGRPELAFHYLQQAAPLMTSPDYPEKGDLYDLINNRAALRLALGDESGARSDLLFVVNQPPGRVESDTQLVTRHHLISLSLRMEDPEAALHHVDLAHRQLELLLAEVAAEGQTLESEGFYRLWNLRYGCEALLQRAEKLQTQGHQALANEVLDQAAVACEALASHADQDSRTQAQYWVEAYGAHLALLRGEMDDAGRRAWQALEYARELGEGDSPVAELTLAKWQSARGEWEAAVASYTQLLRQARTYGQHRLVQRVLDQLAELHEQQGQLDDALRVTREALRHARETLSSLDSVYAMVANMPLDVPDTPESPSFTAGPLSWRDRLSQAERLAQRDPLTGLLNRRGLQQQLEQVQMARQVQMVAVMDIDHFKTINDRHSHQVGDQVLVKVAEVLGSCVRPDTLVCRYGGEEFVLVAPVTDRQAAYRLLRRCQEEIAAFNWKEILPARQVTVTIGFAVGQEAFEELISRADGWMLKAKGAGRNRILPSS